MTRTDQSVTVLRHLLAFDLPIEDLIVATRKLSWDGEIPLVTLTRDHIEAVLRRYLARELSAAEIETWANLIECREDIDFGAGASVEINGLIHELANPLLNEPLTLNRADMLLVVNRSV